MGEIYRAHDSRLGRDVAIKIAGARFSARFEREARAIAALNHPHICTLYDVGPNYLVMELLEGETLAARLRRGPLPSTKSCAAANRCRTRWRKRIGWEWFTATSNLRTSCLTRNGVKVLDFGIAKTTSDSGLTEANAVIGTPAYMAPEQLQDKPADARSDLFSLGLVLYEMAAGTPPFPGSSLGSMLNSAPVNVPPLSGAPDGLGKLILRLLEKEPASARKPRWKSASFCASGNAERNSAAEPLPPRRCSCLSAPACSAHRPGFVHPAPAGRKIRRCPKSPV